MKTTSDQYAEIDRDREEYGVKHSEQLGWAVMRHADVMQVLLDWQTFSSVVSNRLSVPAGMDPPAHTPFRKIIEPYFSPARVAEFEPSCRQLAHSLVKKMLERSEHAEIVGEFARPFAAHAQCDYLGWPNYMEEGLHRWGVRNRKAIREQNRETLVKSAEVFEYLIAEMLDDRRRERSGPDRDLTSRLMFEQVNDRQIKDEEIVSILRNWTAGEIGTIAAAVGIIAHFLAAHPDMQELLRSDFSKLPYAIDEILRITAPLTTNRRVTTRAVNLGGHEIGAKERITILWAGANRDPRVFEDPVNFRWDRDTTKNLLYGAGIHVCPGAPLARMELIVATEELLAQTKSLRFNPERPPVPAEFPDGGFASVPLMTERA
ncbi:MAG: cytochrome P450 [Kiritimatiellae bacterium]|nr:cytochrome P450 [Kiritimatiellia bacterium]